MVSRLRPCAIACIEGAKSSQMLQVQLAGRRRCEVVAAHHLGDALQRVVHDDGQVVGRGAVVAQQHEVVDRAHVGTVQQVIDVLCARLEQAQPWLLGNRFSAADVVLGGGLNYAVTFGAFPALPEFTAYLQRLTARPAYVKVNAG